MPLETYSTTDTLLANRQRLEKPLLWVILLATASFSLAENNPVYLVVGLIGFVINYAAAVRNAEVWVHRILVNLAVLVATLVLLSEIFLFDVLHLLALGHYMILILNCKLFERKRNRDYMQMILLSLLLMVAAAVITDALWMLGAMVLYLLLVSYTAMVFTIKRGLDAAAAARLPGERSGPAEDSPTRPMRDSWPGPTLRRRCLGALVVLLISGAGVLVVSPRLDRTPGSFLSGLPRSGPTATTGFSDVVQLGGEKRIYESDRVVGRVRISPPPGRAIPPNAFYLRGAVFNAFTGQRWRFQSGPELGFEHLPRLGEPLAAEAVRQEIEISTEFLPTIFASYPAVHVDADQGRVGWAPGLNVRLDSLPDGVPRVRYTAWSLPSPVSRDGRRYLRALRVSPPRTARPAFAVPRRVEQLARSWCRDLLEMPAGSQRDMAIARRLAQRLRETYAYSLDLEEADPTRSPLIDFLFHLRKGHCEYFATAHVVMCHALGVRARLATGFSVAGSPADDGSYLIRQRHAHAWTEVYTPQTDWFIVDATPAAHSQPPERTGWRLAFGWWDDVQFWWQSNVVQFNSAVRQRVADWIRLRLDAAAAFLAGAWRNLVDLLRGRQADLLLAAATFGVVLLSVLLAVLAAGMVRRIDPTSDRRNFSRLPRFLGALLQACRRRGAGWKANQTLGQWADQAAEKLHLDRHALDAVIGAYHEIRFSGRRADPDRLAEARRQARCLRNCLQQR